MRSPWSGPLKRMPNERPTATPGIWPSEPPLTSIPGVSVESGCDSRPEPHMP